MHLNNNKIIQSENENQVSEFIQITFVCHKLDFVFNQIAF